MRFFKRITATLMTCCVLVSSFQGQALQVNAAASGWNFAIYMCGSDLESGSHAASSDLIEIMKAKNVPNNVRIIIQTGGSTQWHYEEDIKEFYKNELHMTDETIEKIKINNISADYIQRYRIRFDNKIQQDGKTITYPVLELISENEGLNNPGVSKDAKVVSMGDKEVLSDYVKETASDYEHNVLIFWNHGSGTVGGVCADEYSEDTLSLKEIDDALQENENVISGGKFDMIGFDACLMSTFETLVVASRHAKYAAASMTLEPNDGWYYTPIVETLANGASKGNDFTGEQLSKSVVDAYNEYYLTDKESEKFDKDCNMAAYDLSNMNDLVNKFDAMALSIVHLSANKELKEGFLDAAHSAKAVESGTDLVGFASYFNKTISYANNYIKKNEKSSNETIKENVENCQDYIKTSKELQESIFSQEFCLKRCTGSEESDYYNEKAISFYYPQNDSGDRAKFAKWCYKDLGISPCYAVYVYDIAYGITEKQNQKVTTSIQWNEKSKNYTLNVTSKNSQYLFYTGVNGFIQQDGKSILISDRALSIEDNKANFKPVKKCGTFNGRVAFLSEMDPLYGDYYIFASINGEEAGTYYVINENGVYYSGGELKEGDVITPYYVLENGKMVPDKKAAYTIKKSDINEDGTARLPIGSKKIKENQVSYSVTMVGGNMKSIEKTIDHAATLNFAKAKASLNKSVFKATGNKIYPTVKVQLGNKKLVKGKDYKLVYSNNLGAGKAMVKVVGLGKYKFAAPKVLHYVIKVNNNR